MHRDDFHGGSGGNGRRQLDKPQPTGKQDSLLPPQNIEAEMSVLGSMLLDNSVIGELTMFLKPEDFWRASHKILYRRIVDLYGDGKPVDAVILADELIRRDEFKSVGGDETLAEIMDSTPHAANAEHYGLIVRQKAVSRQIRDAGDKMAREAQSGLFTAEDLLESAEKAVFSIADDRPNGDAVSVGSLVPDALERLDLRKQRKRLGLATGHTNLDDKTGGFLPGTLTVVAGRPGMGKTSLALTWVDHIAIVKGEPVLFVSLEMGREELIDKIICMRTEIDNYKFRNGSLSDQQLLIIEKHRSRIESAPLFIDDTPGRSVNQIAAVARRIKLKHGLKLLVVDYVGLVDSENPHEARNQQIGKVSRGLKRLSRELAIPVVALAQLNRQVEQTDDHRPRMAHLRESGDLEQDAHIVILLYRPEYYDANDQPGIAIAVVDKCRNGSPGDVKLTWRKEITRFENLATQSQITSDPRVGEQQFGRTPGAPF